MWHEIAVEQVAFYSSITSANKGGDGVLVCADSADAEGVGGSKIMGNMLT